jgi:hypothetical protein
MVHDASHLVMPGLDPGIHGSTTDVAEWAKAWMVETRPAMTMK